MSEAGVGCSGEAEVNQVLHTISLWSTPTYKLMAAWHVWTLSSNRWKKVWRSVWVCLQVGRRAGARHVIVTRLSPPTHTYHSVYYHYHQAPKVLICCIILFIEQRPVSLQMNTLVKQQCNIERGINMYINTYALICFEIVICIIAFFFFSTSRTRAVIIINFPSFASRFKRRHSYRHAYVHTHIHTQTYMYIFSAHKIIC